MLMLEIKTHKGPAQLPKVPAVSGQSSNETNPGSAGGEVGALEKKSPYVRRGAPVYALD